MKITQEDESRFTMELTAEDASEGDVSFHMMTIIELAKYIETRGHDQAKRIEDRAGYYRWSQVEKSLMQIRDAANTALLHIKFLDFPQMISRGESDAVN